MTDITPGDIILLKFKGKYRKLHLKQMVKQKHPFLVLYLLPENRMRICASSSQVTSDVINGIYPQDYVIQDLSSTGLNKTTYVATDNHGITSTENFYKKLGELNPQEFAAVLKKHKKYKQRQVLESKIYNTGYPEYLDYQLDSNGSKHFVLID